MLKYGLLLGAIIAIAAVDLAQARPARCFATDEGRYACNFTPIGNDGSFRISARGKPSYTLTVIGPGLATGFLNVSGRNVALPGQFRRSARDGACWENNATKVRICAW
jgi:hypothetical protein